MRAFEVFWYGRLVMLRRAHTHVDRSQEEVTETALLELSDND